MFRFLFQADFLRYAKAIGGSMLQQLLCFSSVDKGRE